MCREGQRAETVPNIIGPWHDRGNRRRVSCLPGVRLEADCPARKAEVKHPPLSIDLPERPSVISWGRSKQNHHASFSEPISERYERQEIL